MKNLIKDSFKEFFFILPGLIFIIYLASQNFLLFHLSIELFSIIIAFSMFVIAINLSKISDNNYFIFLGIAYGFIAGFDLLHTIAYKGMGIFVDQSPNLATQLWIASRYLEVFSLLGSFLFLKNKIKKDYLIVFYSLLTIVLMLSIFQWGIFPDCFIEGEGLTAFKINSEYLIAVLLLSIIVLLNHYRESFNSLVYRYLILSVLATVTAELFFTFYISVYGISNIAGHLFKLLSFYFIYKAVIKESLERPYEVMFNKIIKTKNKLVHKNQELEQVIYAISHDLRSPIVNIKGFSNELELSIEQLQSICSKLDLDSGKREKIEKIINNEIPESIHYISTSVENINRLLKGLLELSRIDSCDLVRDEIDANQILTELISTYKYQIEQQELAVEFGHLPKCRGDEVQFSQIFSNLLDNAIKYSNGRGEIKISGWEEKEQVIYSIEDDGIGIATEDQEQIFSIFNRLGNNDKEGEGLGLTLVKKIIERHQGEIWLESELGVGSKFFVALPK